MPETVLGLEEFPVTESAHLSRWGLRPEGFELFDHLLTHHGEFIARSRLDANRAWKGEPPNIGPMYSLAPYNPRVRVLTIDRSAFGLGSAREFAFECVAGLVSQWLAFAKPQIVYALGDDDVLGPMTPEKYARVERFGEFVPPAPDDELGRKGVRDLVGQGFRLRVPHDPNVPLGLVDGFPGLKSRPTVNPTQRALMMFALREFSHLVPMSENNVSVGHPPMWRMGWRDAGLDGTDCRLFSFGLLKKR